ncbi:MAG: sporulation integral membrane protein YtvI [Defluviitaleaceae bacterium]|nr:sporulation integral membrane protein YtvI [Defluviitaleaceae bacterium]MCL2273695.1 sporulation integral membrane protein YtvI [Defluviitaleaceae bacterium]
MYEIYLRNKKIIDRMAFFALLTFLVYALFTFLWVYLAPFFFGLLIALIMEPLIRLLMNRLQFKRWMSALLCLLLFMAITASLGAWLINTLIRQVGTFVDTAPEVIEDIATRMDLWFARFADSMPDNFAMPDIQEFLLNAVMGLFGGVVQDHAPRAVAAVPEFLINTILALVSAYFFMADRERIFSAIARACPKGLAAHFKQSQRSFSVALRGYLRAQYILMTMVGIISIIGLLIIRSPFALFLGLLFAVLDFLPIVGAGSVLVPWSIMSFVMGNPRQGVSLLIIYGIITVIRQVLQPKILGDQIGIHPLVSLMSIFIGFRLFGLLGLIIGPTLVMMLVAARRGEHEHDTE